MSTQSWSGGWRGASPASISHTRARDVVHSTGTIVRGKFPSRKTGRLVQHEGLLELDAIYLFEAAPQVAHYTEQPEKFIYPDGTKTRRYTPDFLLTLISGAQWAVEVKPLVYAQQPETAHKLRRIAEHMTRLDRQFIVMTDEFIGVEPRLSNLKWIYHRAPRRAAADLSARVGLARYAHQFPMSIAEAIGLLRPLNLDPFALLLSGHLTCDLNTPLAEESFVSISPEKNHDDICIASWNNF